MINLTRTDEAGVRWLTVSEAAREYNLQPRNIRWACENGKIAGATQRNDKGPWMIPEPGLRAWIATKRKRSQV
jgi:hypothetical protein